MASSTDVRQWLREQGRGDEAGHRGAVAAALVEEYEAAHPGARRPVAGPVVAGEVVRDDVVPDVTEADFPSAPEAADSGPAAGGERKPRKVAGPAAGKKITERLFGGRGKGKHKSSRGRAPLGDFAEDAWTDLAWLAEPIPPLSKILTIQAPFAGAVIDDAVRGTFVDGMVQPIARHAGTFRALNGLAGPPVYVAMICAMGRREQATDPATNLPAIYPDGSPVMDYDARTKMLFTGLRYSLLQMTKISDVKAEEIRERTQNMAERMHVVDQIIADLFALPAAVVPEQPPQDDPGAGGFPSPRGAYPYPEAPVMDGTGADPGRMLKQGSWSTTGVT